MFLEGTELYGAVGLLGFLTGSLAVMLVRSRKAAALEERSLELGKSINSLKAEKNVLEKKLADSREKVTELEEGLATRDQRIEELELAYGARNDQLEQTRSDLKVAVKQTHELRKDLAQHAEETLRAEAHARDVENELSMLTTSGEALDSELQDELAEAGKS